MSIQIAKSAGFCFGVNRAVEMVYRLLEEGKQVYTLGPIIHNPQLVAELSDRGVQIVENPEEVPQSGTLVIRSHGVPQSVMDRAENCKITCADATCPFVAKIHKIVRDASARGEVVLVAGDRHHPEVEGILGHCSGPYFVFKNQQEL